MPRANRYFLPGHVWHITHRCHQKEFLLKFARDRDRWLHWLFEARKRYGLCVLDYTVTSNHIHLLVKDTDEYVIPKSMQLIAGRSAQEFNLRKRRNGAYWEDRYHGTAIQSGTHLIRCVTYIDLNMVRAGVVQHPDAWRHGGYVEIQNPPERYSIINRTELARLCGFQDTVRFQTEHRQWIAAELRRKRLNREPDWAGAIAVGSQRYLKDVQEKLDIRTIHRERRPGNDGWQLKESRVSYSSDFAYKMVVLSD